MDDMERIDRRSFLRKASHWAVGLGALGLTGTLMSCSSGSGEESGTSTTTISSGTASNDTATQDQPQSPGATGSLKAVVTDECAGCGKCVRACNEGAISISGRKAVISDACRGCGDCVRFCPIGAIVLTQSGSAASRVLTGSGSPTA